VINTRNKYHL